MAFSKCISTRNLKIKPKKKRSCAILRFHVIKLKGLSKTLSNETLQIWHSLVTSQSTNFLVLPAIHLLVKYFTAKNFFTWFGLLAAWFIST